MENAISYGSSTWLASLIPALVTLNISNVTGCFVGDAFAFISVTQRSRYEMQENEENFPCLSFFTLKIIIWMYDFSTILILIVIIIRATIIFLKVFINRQSYQKKISNVYVFPDNFVVRRSMHLFADTVKSIKRAAITITRHPITVQLHFKLWLMSNCGCCFLNEKR